LLCFFDYFFSYINVFFIKLFRPYSLSYILIGPFIDYQVGAKENSFVSGIYKSGSSDLLYFDFYKQDLECFDIMYTSLVIQDDYYDYFGFVDKFDIDFHDYERKMPFVLNENPDVDLVTFRFIFSHFCYMSFFEWKEPLYLRTPTIFVHNYLNYWPVPVADEMRYIYSLFLRFLKWLSEIVQGFNERMDSCAWGINFVSRRYDLGLRVIRTSTLRNRIPEFLPNFYIYIDRFEVYNLLEAYQFTVDPFYRFLYFPFFSIINYERYFGIEEIGFQYGRLERMVNILGWIDCIEEFNEEDGVIMREEEALLGKSYRLDEGIPRMSLFDFSNSNYNKLLVTNEYSQSNAISNIKNFFFYDFNLESTNISREQMLHILGNQPNYSNACSYLPNFDFYQWFKGSNSEETDSMYTLKQVIPLISSGFLSVKKAAFLFFYETLMYLVYK